jgi:hypothetical protein
MERRHVRWLVGLGVLGVIGFAVYQRFIVKPADERSEETPFPSDPARPATITAHERPDDPPSDGHGQVADIDLSEPLATGDIDRGD